MHILVPGHLTDKKGYMNIYFWFFISLPSLFPLNILSAPPNSFLTVINKFDYVFAENGTVQYKNGQLVSKQVGLASLSLPPMLKILSIHLFPSESLQRERLPKPSINGLHWVI